MPLSSQKFSIGLHPNEQANKIPNTNSSIQELPNFYQERPVKMVVPEKLTLPMDICYTYDFMNRQIVLQNGGICATLPVRNYWIDTNPSPISPNSIENHCRCNFSKNFHVQCDC